MAIAFLAVYTFLCFPEHMLAGPDYRKLHESLSLKKDIANSNFKTAHQDGTPIIAEIGKVFKFSLDDYVLKGDVTSKPIVSSFICICCIYIVLCCTIFQCIVLRCNMCCIVFQCVVLHCVIMCCIAMWHVACFVMPYFQIVKNQDVRIFLIV